MGTSILRITCEGSHSFCLRQVSLSVRSAEGNKRIWMCVEEEIINCTLLITHSPPSVTLHIHSTQAQTDSLTQTHTHNTRFVGLHRVWRKLVCIAEIFSSHIKADQVMNKKGSACLCLIQRCQAETDARKRLLRWRSSL